MAGSSPSGVKHFFLTLLVAGAVFAGVAPTLTWPQFTGGNENIVVQTALEMRRGGPWLVPHMLGEPRIKKPPLVAWITALSMRQHTLDQLDDPSQRDAAYRQLAWQVRWTGLLAACAMIVATFFLGKVLFDSRLGLLAAVVVGTTMLFQKYMRQSTSDVHLAMWVTVANTLFACAIVKGRVWTGVLLGSSAVAMAFLCKGPVAIVETVLPAAIAAFCWHRGQTKSEKKASWGRRAIVVGLGALLFCAIALPWFAYVYLTVPDVGGTWATEVSRQDATGLGPDPAYAYLLRIPMNWPWLVVIVVGAIVMWRARSRSDLYTALLVVVPIAVMTLIPDRKERYLLPMLPPLAIICARGMAAWLDAPKSERTGRWVTGIHVFSLAIICIGFPILGATHPDLVRLDGSPWYPRDLAMWLAVGFAMVIGLGLVSRVHRRAALVVATFVCMIAFQAVVMFGYRDSESGRSRFRPLAETIRNTGASGVFDFDERVRIDEELAIYLNRTVLPADPATLTPADAPIVYVTRQGRDEDAPTAPPGWQLLTTLAERKNTWWAYIAVPAQTAGPPASP